MSGPAPASESLLHTQPSSVRSGRSTVTEMPDYDTVDLEPQKEVERTRREGRSRAHEERNNGKTSDSLWESFRRHRDSIFRQELWNKEATLLLLGAVVLAIIAIVLKLNDGRPLSSWHASNSITLNAFISVLTTVLWLVLTPVQTKCIGQLRWMHFHASDGRSLSDFQTFADAHGGGPGSLELLFTPGKSWLTRFAAMVALVQLTINPFTQQILGTGDRNFATSEPASLPIAHQLRNPGNYSNNILGVESSGVDAGSSIFGGRIDPASLGFVSSVLDGIFAPAVSEFPVATDCASGNCTWGPYATLMLEPTILNVTHQLRYASEDDLATWLSNYSAVQEQANASFINKKAPWYIASLPDAAEVNPGITVSWLIDEVIHRLQHVKVPRPPQQDGKNFSSVSLDLTAFQVQPLNSFSTYNDTVQIYSGKNWLTVDVYYQEMQFNGTVDGAGFQNVSVAYKTGVAWRANLDLTVQSATAEQQLGNLEEHYVGESMHYDGPACFANRTSVGPPVGCNLTYEHDSEDFAVDALQADYLSSAIATGLEGFNFVADYHQLDANSGEIYSSTGVNNYTSLVAFYLMEAAVTEIFGTPELISGHIGANGTGSALSKRRRPAGIVRASSTGAAGGDGGGGGSSGSSSNVTVTVEQAFGNMARSVSTWLRASNGKKINGTLSRTQTTYAVSWGWIAIPAGLIAFTTILLVFTALETRRKGVPAWADSILAVLAHELEDDETRARLAKVHKFEELRNVARKTKVRLRERDNVLETL